jgi:4-amino-4-deoxy-L-arabinose transferase-like glycosyltransferase/Flp pilus assembly protein TadD
MFAASRRPLLVFLVALLVKVAVLWSLGGHPLLQPSGDLDTAIYVNLARSGPPPVVYFVSPLYLYFLKLAGASIDVARILQILLGSIGVVLLFDTARRWFGDRGAIVTAVLAILTGVITFNEVTILQSALDPFLVSLTLWLLTRALQSEDDDARLFAATGGAAALFVLNRPNVLLWVAALAILLLVQRRIRGAVAFGCGVALFLAPVAIRNYTVAHELVLVSSHGGLNFYIGNNESADGTYHAVPGIRPTIAGQAVDARQMAETATHRKLTSNEVSSWFYGRAAEWMRAHPAAALGLFARKLAYTIHQTDLALNFSYDYFRHDTPSPLRVLLVGPWLLVPLGIAGAATRFGDRRFRTFLSFVPVYAVSVAIFFVASRYRLPLLAVFAICAAGVVHVRRAWQIALGLAAAVIVLWPFGLDSGRSYEQTNMVVWLIEHKQAPAGERLLHQIEATHIEPARLHYQAGMAFAAAGDAPRAIALLEQVLRDPVAQPVLRAAATDELARGYIHARRTEDARRLFARIDASSLSTSRAENVGRLALTIRDGEDAARFLAVAVERDPKDARAWQDLGVALLATNELPHAITALTTARTLQPNDAATYLFLALARAQAGEIAEARRNAEEALRLRPNFPDARHVLEELPRK